MAYQQPDDYNTVAERIIEFRQAYPNGSLQPADPDKPYRLEVVDGKPWVVVVAAAYRTPDDTRPGIGMAYEPVPGPTPYTRGSELQNAETAAWGRAIIAALAGDAKKGIASKDEVLSSEAKQHAEAVQQRVQQRQQEQPPQQEGGEPPYAAWYAEIESRKGDREGLLALYNEARSKHLHRDVIDAIKAAGNEAAEGKGQGNA